MLDLALFNAASRGEEALVRALLAQGADPLYAVDDIGDCAALVGIARGMVDLFQEYLDVGDAHGRTGLHDLVASGNTAGASRAAELGADFDVWNGDELSPRDLINTLAAAEQEVLLLAISKARAARMDRALTLATAVRKARARL